MSAHLDDVLTKALRASSTKVEHPEIERLRAEVRALRAELAVLAGDGWKEWRA